MHNQAIKDYLIDLKATCEKNISTLAGLIQRYGRQAPAHTKDFKGYFMQGFQAMRGWPSDQGLMRALHSNLQLLIGGYEDAFKKALPDDVKEPVSQIYEKARERLKYLQSQI